MKLSTLLLLAFLFRILMLAAQRFIGMDWDFHVDATYYVDSINYIYDAGIREAVLLTGYENFFYILVGYALHRIGFGFFESYNLLIFFNVILSVASVWLLCEIYGVKREQGVPLPALFFAFSPYLAHLAVHPLKDASVLFFSLALLLSLARDRWLSVLVISVFLVFTRYHLGLMTVMLLFGWRVAVGLRFSRLSQALGIAALMLLMYFGFYDQLNDRIELFIEGRDFYPDGFALVPDSLFFRFFFGGLFNFLVPYPFIPSRFSDVGYFFHLLFFLLLSFWSFRLTARQAFVRFDGRVWMFGAALLLFSFILTTTPVAGPMVRYRLFAEIMFLISIGRPILLKRGRLS